MRTMTVGRRRGSEDLWPTWLSTSHGYPIIGGAAIRSYADAVFRAAGYHAELQFTVSAWREMVLADLAPQPTPPGVNLRDESSRG